MVIEVTQLPAEEPPRQITARYVVDSLGEHFVAFLAANNLSGWREDDEYVLRDDKFVDVLLSISTTTGLYLGQFKKTAYQLRKLAEASGNKVKVSNINEMLAKALGYANYYVAYKCRTVDDFIQNAWPSVGAMMSLGELDKELKNTKRHSKTINDLRERYRYNKVRDQQMNDPAARQAKGEKRRKVKENRNAPIQYRT